MEQAWYGDGKTYRRHNLNSISAAPARQNLLCGIVNCVRVRNRPVLLGQLCMCLKEGTNSYQLRLTVQTTLLLVEICRQHTGRSTHFAFLGAIENMRGPFKHMIDVVEQSRRIPGAPRGFVKQVDRRQLAAQLAIPRSY